MSLLQKLKHALFFDGGDIEAADRRAFMVGMSVTAAGLLVPKATIFLPPERRRSFRVDSITIDGVSFDFSAVNLDKTALVFGRGEQPRWVEVTL